MNIFIAYKEGFKNTGKHLPMVFLIYIINLILALSIAIPFFSLLKDGFGHSMAHEKLMQGFNYTVISDFIKHPGKILTALNPALKTAILLFFIVSIFLTGGILNNLRSNRYLASDFFTGAAYYFYRFLRLSIYMIILQLIFAVAVYLPMGLIIGGVMDSLTTEKAIIFIVEIAIIIHLFFMGLLIMISDYTKFRIVLSDTNRVLAALWKSTRFVFNHFLRTYGLFLLLFISVAAWIGLYFGIKSIVGFTTTAGLIIMFFVQQIFMLGRSWFRIWLFDSQLSFFISYYLSTQEKKKQKIKEWDKEATEISEKKERKKRIVEEEKKIGKVNNEIQEVSLKFNELNQKIAEIEKQTAEIEEKNKKQKQEFIHKQSKEEWEIIDSKSSKNKSHKQPENKNEHSSPENNSKKDENGDEFFELDF